MFVGKLSGACVYGRAAPAEMGGLGLWGGWMVYVEAVGRCQWGGEGGACGVALE